MATSEKVVWILVLLLIAVFLIGVGLSKRDAPDRPPPVYEETQYASETTVQPNPDTTQPDLTPKPLPRTGGVPIP